MRVLVERAVNRLEFPEFDVFDPAAGGMRASSCACASPQRVVDGHGLMVHMTSEKRSLWRHRQPSLRGTLSPSALIVSGGNARCCPADVDLCITLGGDGTVLHLASLFVADEPLPPVVSFAMGTLGFLTPFDVTDFADTLNRVRWRGMAEPGLSSQLTPCYR